jgi:D-arginine dehydrogenase
MAKDQYDVAIIGAGIAGAAAAANLPRHLRVLMLEAEGVPGFHATGRSAAVFSTIYGNASIRALSRASEPFLRTPPAGFADQPLVSPRGVLFIARADQAEAMATLAEQLDVAGATRRLSALQAAQRSPLLRSGYVAEALFEEAALDPDVNALHAGFLREARARGTTLVTDARLRALARSSAGWSLDTTAGPFETAVLINAAGAWADRVAEMGGVRPKRIRPLQRTVVLVDTAEPLSGAHGPFTVDVDEAFYFKPESGGLLLSPADETPVEPGDVQPEELDVAIAIDRVERATTLTVRRIRNKWAGLRSFAPDRTPVVGFDPDAPNFFWLAGQGGYGIQTAPALGVLAAALVTEGRAPDPIVDQGLDLTSISPARRL